MARIPRDIAWILDSVVENVDKQENVLTGLLWDSTGSFLQGGRNYADNEDVDTW